jgi:hypothetical protein
MAIQIPVQYLVSWSLLIPIYSPSGDFQCKLETNLESGKTKIRYRITVEYEESFK